MDVVDSTGPVLPPLIRDAFGQMPKGLVDPTTGAELAQQGYSGVHPDWKIRKNLKSRKVIDDVVGSLDYSQHWQHASTKWKQGPSLETSHNDVHVSVGKPMAQIKFAAWCGDFRCCFDIVLDFKPRGSQLHEPTRAVQ